ncbi:MAG: type I restriction enzyme HsdR N-terminal domain-containing protein [Cytophagales bacterium]|nr:type I restriction enzyme HsdR N-terminal domain-containing protein [Cytophagales bacterium]
MKLNLPSFDYQLKKIDDKVCIFDIIRKKYLVLTPEEWVRQNFLHFLISKYQYPKSLITTERGLAYNQLQKRTDIVIYDRNGKPFLVVECKAPDVPINQKTFNQVSVYNQVHKAPYICVTNGMVHYCCEINHENNNFSFLKDLPQFSK